MKSAGFGSPHTLTLTLRPSKCRAGLVFIARRVKVSIISGFIS